MANQPSDEQWRRIEEALYAGRKIEAIKHFREATGSGLKEAKDVLDEHEAQLRAQSPGRFTAKKGCLVLVLASVGATIIGVTAAGVTIFG